MQTGPIEQTYDVGLSADRPEPASWARRVVAYLLDAGVISTALFLSSPVQPVVGPFLWETSPQAGESTWTQSSWAVVTVALMLLMKAYLGATPGKLAAGIALVRTDTRRPLGLLRTVGREILHLLDAILFLGYLRPLWHPERRTFADSLARTTVLHTDRPLLHPWFERLREARSTTAPREAAVSPDHWQRSHRPQWLRVTTSVSTTLVLVGAAFSLGPTSYAGAAANRASCAVTGAQGGTVDLWGGDLAVGPSTGTLSRFGITRLERSTEPEGVVVQWHLDGDHPENATLRLVLADADGNQRRVVDHRVRDWEIQAGPGEPTGQYGVRLPLSVLDGLEPGWTWSLSVLDAAGLESTPCAGADPAVG